MSVYDNLVVSYGHHCTPLPPPPVSDLRSLSQEIVVSRTSDGNPLSYFGDNCWDWSALTPKREKWSFKSDEFSSPIVWEIKIIQYARFYWAPKSRCISSINPKIIYLLAKWAENNSVSIERMLNDERLYPYIASSLSKLGHRNALDVCSMVNELTRICLINDQFTIGPPNFVLYDLLLKTKNTIPKTKIKQTEVIPTRIYAHLILCFGKSLEEFNENFDNIYSFYKALNERFESENNTNFITNLKKSNKWTTFLETYGVKKLAAKHGLDNKKSWNKYIREISEEAKYWIHLFTGMRDTEVNTLEYDCLSEIETYGTPAKIIRGYTSKTLGSGATATYWITSKIIDCGLTAAQNYGLLCEIENDQYKVNKTDYPLFPQQQAKSWDPERNPHKNAPYSTGFAARKRFNQWLIKYPELMVNEGDMEELRLFDGFRDWSSDVVIGKVWPLSTHQCRRSLAVYMSRSGMVSLGSLQFQFKHLMSAMTSYYRKGSVFAKNFIMNDEDDDFHRNQILFMNTLEQEQRMAQFLDYEQNVIEKQDKLWGGEGTRIRRAYEAGNPLIITIDRKRTESSFMRGEMNYKRSPVGGCISAEPCEKLSISNPVACFGCSKSILDDESLTKGNFALRNLYKSRDKYSLTSLHYLQTQVEIDSLEKKLKEAEALLNGES